MTPQARSTSVLRIEGWHVEVVEHINRWAGLVKRKDLFGFADLLCIRPNEVLVVQVTSASNHAARRNKIAESDLVGRVRDAGIRIELHSWRKNAQNTWTLKREDLS